MFEFVAGFVVGVATCLAAAIFFPQPWLHLLKETREEVKKGP